MAPAHRAQRPERSQRLVSQQLTTQTEPAGHRATGVEAVASVRLPVDPWSPEALGSVQLLLCPERLPLAQGCSLTAREGRKELPADSRKGSFTAKDHSARKQHQLTHNTELRINCK